MTSVISWRRITVRDTCLNVGIAGSGPAVLLVHGFPDDSSVWRHQIPALVAAGYQVIVPDMRGCGESGIPDGKQHFHIDHLTSDLKAVLDALGLKRVMMVGHDWGAVIGWFFAMDYPQYVSSYVALSVGHPLAYATGGLMQKLKGWYAVFFLLPGLAERLLRAGNWWLFRRLTGHAGETPRWISAYQRAGRLTAGLNYYRANLLQLLLRRRYAPVSCDVLGIWSSGDRFLTEKQMQRSGSLVAGEWRYLRIASVGHWMQVDAPERINQELLTYFKEKHHALI